MDNKERWLKKSEHYFQEAPYEFTVELWQIQRMLVHYMKWEGLGVNEGCKYAQFLYDCFYKRKDHINEDGTAR